MKAHKQVIATAIAAIVAFAAIAPAGAADADTKRFEVCRAKLKAAQKLDLLYDMQWPKGSYPFVVVGPTYDTLPFDAREGFAETANCFFNAGKTGQYINFDLLDWQTHKVVAQFSYGKLVSD